MNLQEVRMHHYFRPACCGCGWRMDHSVKVWADFDGVPFKAYYCTPCAQHMRAREGAYKMADERDAQIMGQFVRLAFNAETRARRMMLLSGLAGFDRTIGLPAEPEEEPDQDACTHPGGHEFECSGTQYGGDDDRWHGEGRCLCIWCGADGDG